MAGKGPYCRPGQPDVAKSVMPTLPGHFQPAAPCPDAYLALTLPGLTVCPGDRGSGHPGPAGQRLILHPPFIGPDPQPTVGILEKVDIDPCFPEIRGKPDLPCNSQKVLILCIGHRQDVVW